MNTAKIGGKMRRLSTISHSPAGHVAKLLTSEYASTHKRWLKGLRQEGDIEIMLLK